MRSKIIYDITEFEFFGSYNIFSLLPCFGDPLSRRSPWDLPKTRLKMHSTVSQALMPYSTYLLIYSLRYKVSDETREK